MLESFAVVTVVAMLLLSNLTSAAAFKNIPLDKTENTRGLNNDSLDSSTFPAGDINLNSKSSAKDDASPFAFKGLWGLNDFAKNNFRGIDTSFSGVVNYNDHIVADGDSVQLIIGVDYTKSWAYENVANAVANSQGRIVNTVSLKDMVIAVVADVPLNTVSSFIEQMSKNPFVRYVEPNMKRQALLEPNDINWTVQWGPKKIEANYAWNTTLGSSDIIVAVVDTGVDYTHPDLAGNYLALGYDWVNDDPYPLDDFGHGTHCAGIIAAVINNSIGIAGLAQVKIMAEKVLDDWGYGSDDWVANGIIHAADYGAKIISMSLGGYGYSRLLHEAVKYAYDDGVLLVAAAGNDNVNLKSYPAAYEEVVAVSATNQNDLKAWFSNWGEWIELAAPGVSIYSTMPTYHVTLNDYGYLNNYDYMGGTSMACPHVAGTAALIWSQYPDATNDWVRTQLRCTIDDLGVSGFDEYYGYGRVNARKAVQQEPPEHDLLILNVQGPKYICPGDQASYNVTVQNFGRSDETNLNVSLIVNGSLIDSESIGFLANGTSIKTTLSWTPSTEGMYNVTFWVEPVSGETNVLNNILSWFVTVTYPLINPVEGQWASYVISQYNPGTGQLLYREYWNLTYEDYIEPYRIYITIAAEDIYGNVYMDWMIVNTLSRLVEEGVWADLWYPGWIETDINIGSKVNLLYENATVTGSEIILIGVYPVECWELTYPLDGAQYLFWYDKITGLWIGMDLIVSYYTSPYMQLRLVETNIPIGTTYSRELATTLETPPYLEPGDTVILNATAYNIGLNDETDVKLSIFINGTEVASETFNLPSGSSHTISHIWTPETEAFYNITAFVRPLLDEFTTINNKAEKIVRVVKIKGYVLFDQTHYTDSIFVYSTWVRALENEGYITEVLTTTPINKSTFEGYDIFVIPQAWNYYTSDELNAIKDFMRSGGGLLVIGDDYPDIYTQITSFAGISWYGEGSGYGGYTTDITPHPVTDDVISVYFGYPGRLLVSSPAQDLIRDRYGNVMLAVAEVGLGAVVCIADEDSINNYYISYVDNLRLAVNMIGWLANRPPHVSVEYSPLDPYVGEAVTFNASTSYDPDGTIVDYVWDFGDGTVEHGVVITHVYEKGGTYTMSCTATDNDGLNTTLKMEITVQRTTLNLQVKAGAMHFPSETAEFYILASSLGEPVNADVSAQLYFNGSLYANLTGAIETVGLGFYRIPYTIPWNASAGTYTLIVKAKYYSLSGVSIESFLVSQTLTSWNAHIDEIKDGIATVVIPGLNEIKLNLTDMKTKLQDIFIKVVAINGTTAQIQTTLGIVNGTVAEIKANMALIVVPGLGQIQTDVSGLIGMQETWIIPQYLIMVFSLVAAISAVLSAALLMKSRKAAKT
jgi:subtilisin family serine protease/PKD repeat protein